jgi:hypothetical protein
MRGRALATAPSLRRSRFRVVKVFFDPEKLAGEFGRHGFRAEGGKTAEFFLYLKATRQ